MSSKKKITIIEDDDNENTKSISNNVVILDIKKINELLDIHIDYVLKIKKFINNNKFKLRLPNFPEGISENIIREYISKVEKRECRKSQTGGDLEIYENKKSNKIEVKCFTSDGPTSFGPTEKWTQLYFLDGKDFLNKNFKIYKINLANDSEIFNNIKINAEKTYKDVCKEGKRPRINFNQLKHQLADNIELVYQGNLDFN